MNYRLEAEKKANPEFVKIMLELINKENLEKKKENIVQNIAYTILL